uniref:Uncharacterized protein n=4 Tax=Gossypium TaxID=3633 RepID=A0A0D2UXN4_GOSRA|nr:hypothetical protein B456_011G243300 [Gossypium raimondii]
MNIATNKPREKHSKISSETVEFLGNMSHSPLKSPLHNLQTTELHQHSIPNVVHVPKIHEPVVAYPDPYYLQEVSTLTTNNLVASNPPQGYRQSPIATPAAVYPDPYYPQPQAVSPVMAYPDPHYLQQLSTLATNNLAEEVPPVPAMVSSSASNPPQGYPQRTAASLNVKPAPVSSSGGCCIIL